MPDDWSVAVRWIIVRMPSGRTWTSAAVRTAEALQQELAEGLRQPGTSGPPVIMWEMRDPQGHVFTPAEQAHHLDVLRGIDAAMQAQGI